MANKDGSGSHYTAGDLEQVIASDAFLSDLSRGVDPSGGEDALAGLLLNLREEAVAEAPEAPVLAGTADPGPVKGRRRGPGGRAFAHGLVGAAAATLLIAGVGTAIFNAPEGSALYPMRETIFDGTDIESVELAGKLDEIDSRAASGDTDGVRLLLEQARKLVQATGDGRAIEEEERVPAAPQAVTVTAPAPAAAEPETLTETVTLTQTVTETPSESTEEWRTLEPTESFASEPAAEPGGAAGTLTPTPIAPQDRP